MDWQVGDRAVYVGVKKTAANAHRFKGPKLLKRGRVYIVQAVLPPRGGEIGLIIDGPVSRHSTGAWSELNFRKIRPDELTECEPEFVELLNKSRQGVTA